MIIVTMVFNMLILKCIVGKNVFTLKFFHCHTYFPPIRERDDCLEAELPTFIIKASI